jgi:hypothetical protein
MYELKRRFKWIDKFLFISYETQIKGPQQCDIYEVWSNNIWPIYSTSIQVFHWNFNIELRVSFRNTNTTWLTYACISTGAHTCKFFTGNWSLRASRLTKSPSASVPPLVSYQKKSNLHGEKYNTSNLHFHLWLTWGCNQLYRASN